MHIHDQLCVKDFLVIKYAKKKVISHFKVGTYDLAILLFMRKKEL